MPLTDITCRTARAGPKNIKLADEKGLYLLVTPAGKYWRWDYRYLGKRKTMALGVYPEKPLGKARDERDVGRQILSDGLDPMVERKSQRLMKRTAADNTFKSVAEAWLAFKSKNWAKVTRDKTLAHLEADLFPDLGSRPVSDIPASLLLAVLQKVAARGAHYTATRLREVAGQIFRFAIAHDFARDNPAVSLKGLLTSKEVRHRPAITDPRQLKIFLRELSEFDAADPLTKSATKLALLTFVRSQELRRAVWSEIDFNSKEWRIPAARMKTAKNSKQAHVVPLSKEAIQELHELQAITGGSGDHYIFPNQTGKKPYMSENTIGRMLIRLGYKDKQSLHGFRATARSLLSERGWTEAALERQLDHKEPNKVKASYARSEHLPERRRIMDDWGALVRSLDTTHGRVAAAATIQG